MKSQNRNNFYSQPKSLTSQIQKKKWRVFTILRSASFNSYECIHTKVYFECIYTYILAYTTYMLSMHLPTPSIIGGSGYNCVVFSLVDLDLDPDLKSFWVD